MPDYIEIADAGGTLRKVSVDEVASQFVQRLKMQFGVDGAATDVSAASPLPVDDTAAVAVLEGILAALGSTSNVDVLSLPELPAGSKAIGKVEVSKLDEALPTGTNSIGQVDPRGNVAHGAVDAGNPIKVGGRARTELPAAVPQDDRADLMTDKFGRVLVVPAPLDQVVNATINRTTEEAGQLFAALATGAYVVTAISVTNAHATVSTKVEILDGETVKWKGYAGKEGGGFVIAPGHPLFVGSKNTALKAKCATTGADVDISVSAYKIPA